MESSAHVWISCAACAHEEDDIKANKDTMQIYSKLIGIKNIEIYKSKVNLWGCKRANKMQILFAY